MNCNMTRVAFVRDHSASMTPLRNEAMKDFNSILNEFKASVQRPVSSLIPMNSVNCTIVKCRPPVLITYRYEEVITIPSMLDYETTGRSTPLWDSVGTAIEALEAANQRAQYNTTDKNALSDAFLVMVITDGEENSSSNWSVTSLMKKINALQATDRWTFVFRVPKGSKKHLVNLGIPSGNVMEWDQTEAAFQQSTVETTSSVRSYMEDRTKGVTYKTQFFTNLDNVSPETLKKSLVDVTNNVKVVYVTKNDDGKQIRDFCNDKIGKFETGHTLYQLTKKEPIVQDYKKLYIRNKTDGKIYGGSNARTMLGLPEVGNIAITPGDHGQYDIFIQSNSVNRKVQKDTCVLYV